MFFLVPYNIVDREDINLNQKMIAIYLARIQDERGPSYSPTVAEIAAKLKLSEEEVSLSLDFLVSRGILSRDQVEVKEASFDKLEGPGISEFRESKEEAPPSKPLGSEAKREEARGEEVKSEEGLELTEENMNSLLEALELAEERVRERASQLKLNVRKRKRALNQAQAMEELERAQERLREAEKSEATAQKEILGSEKQEKQEQGAYDEVDELLKLLQTSAKDEGGEGLGSHKKVEREEVRLKNRNFQKVSSVYNSVKKSLPRNKIDEKTPK